jgi:hypothetical protein
MNDLLSWLVAVFIFLAIISFYGGGGDSDAKFHSAKNR